MLPIQARPAHLCEDLSVQLDVRIAPTSGWWEKGAGHIGGALSASDVPVDKASRSSADIAEVTQDPCGQEAVMTPLIAGLTRILGGLAFTS
jgi:hypothetical protein